MPRRRRAPARRGALLLTEELRAATAFFGDREVVNLEGQATTDNLVLAELDRGQRFRVPRSEKAERGSRVLLTAR